MNVDAERRWCRVRTGCRLHFGLLALPRVQYDTHWPDVEGQPTLPVRHFGGVGLMLDEPGVELAVRPADDWSAEGPHGETLQHDARILVKLMEDSPFRVRPGPFQLRVDRVVPAHLGLGSGTQLALALAAAVVGAFGLPQQAPAALARLAGRGRRSAIGVHGFFHGGFVVDGGQGAGEELGRLVARERFPAGWRVLLVLPREGRGLHGHAEAGAFADLQRRPPDLAQTEAMCRLVLLGMLPALQARDLETFGEALYDFNRRAGEMYRSVQGGTYAHAMTADTVAFLRQQGVRGAGQSSWGPAVFGVVEEDQAAAVAEALRQRLGATAEVIVASAANRGGEVIEPHA
jgi:beta-RFAP synthase